MSDTHGYTFSSSELHSLQDNEKDEERKKMLREKLRKESILKCTKPTCDFLQAILDLCCTSTVGIAAFSILGLFEKSY